MTTIMGIVLGLAAVVIAIIQVSNQDVASVKNYTDIYISIPSFMLVFGGTVAATLIAHPIQHLCHGFKGFFRMFIKKPFSFDERIDEICEFGEAYNKRGVSGLEDKMNAYVKDNLFKKGINMVVNGYPAENVMEFMDVSMSRLYDREMIDHYVFKTMGRAAPAFGMVGTLVGLIFMLNVMGSDPSRIGPFLAVALVTTFYGLIFTHLLFNPMGNKMLHVAELNIRIRRLEKDGIWLILQKQHPVFIRDQLSSHVTAPQKNAANVKGK
jgi:chemotaxis protein MotA